MSGQHVHVYLGPWDNEEVESMFLVMELFLLVRHTYSSLRMKMEDGHTQKHAFPRAKTDAHMFTQPQSH